LHWIHGDLTDPAACAGLLAGGSTFINLAFPVNWSNDMHLVATANLARAVSQHGVRRVVHCSTAVVVGTSAPNTVTENTFCRPNTEYEKVKLQIEESWRHHAAGRFELVIARPTAVFGPNGKNLLKLAAALTTGNRFINYLRSSLFGHRTMNLVCVGNLVSALEFLVDSEEHFEGNTFIVSDDDDDGNNFRAVERALMHVLGVPDYWLPPLPVPLPVLSTLIRLLAPAKASPTRIYNNSLLKEAGWRRSCDLRQGLDEFAQWYRSTRTQAAEQR
jgi:nucleoside-diphosphate-sugar epimerase